MWYIPTQNQQKAWLGRRRGSAYMSREFLLSVQIFSQFIFLCIGINVYERF